MKINLLKYNEFYFLQLSSCGSWVDECISDSRALSPAIETRLRQPLIGLGVLPVNSDTSNGLVAVQLTKSGDLFYQLLRKHSGLKREEQSVDSSERLSGREVSSANSNERLNGNNFVSNRIKQKCQDWIEKSFELYNAKPEQNENANISSQRAMLNEGSITDAFGIQIEHSEVLRQHSEHDATGNCKECRELEKSAESCQDGANEIESHYEVMGEFFGSICIW